MTHLDRKLWLCITTNLRQGGYLDLSGRSLEKGFTLIESLVAAVVVTILIVSIGPMIALSTAARVNARRVDQAVQAGRGYIEAVKAGLIDTSGFPASLRNVVNSQGQYTFNVAAPTSETFPIPSGCTLDISDPSQKNIHNGRVPGVCVDANGDGFRIDDPQDMVIQPMRSGGTDSAVLTNEGFWLAVRVYRADAFASGTALKTETECESIGNSNKQIFTGTQGSQACPLVSMRSQIMFGIPLLDSVKTGTGSQQEP